LGDARVFIRDAQLVSPFEQTMLLNLPEYGELPKRLGIKL
jgi:hypothetical protein